MVHLNKRLPAISLKEDLLRNIPGYIRKLQVSITELNKTSTIDIVNLSLILEYKPVQ